jgi:hypothetical protein
MPRQWRKNIFAVIITTVINVFFIPVRGFHPRLFYAVAMRQGSSYVKLILKKMGNDKGETHGKVCKNINHRH